MKRVAFVAISVILWGPALLAQTKTLSLEEAISLGVKNSKQLKLSATKVDAALNEVQKARELSWPSLKASAGYSHALMLTRSFALPSSNGQAKSLELPFDNSLYQAGFGFNEPLYAAHKFQYARQSADLLVKMSRLDAEKDQQQVIYTLISAYINYYSILQNQQVYAQNLQDIDQKLQEIRKFEKQGLATRNDVLRYELQQSEIQLAARDLENNREIANYNMNLMLGLPDSTDLHIEAISYKLDPGEGYADYLKQAYENRKEFASYRYQAQMTDLDLKKVYADRLPTVGLGANFYYINPSKAVFPKSGSFLAPFLIGLNLNWDISSLYKTKTRVAEVRNRQDQLAADTALLSDQVKKEVYSAYKKYEQSLDRIKTLETSVAQATENERIMESKFRNNLATTTDRIDAQTLLYRARIDLELAKALATQSYYDLLEATGQIHP